MPIKLPSFRPRRDAYPPDLWTKCPSCGEMLFNKQLDKVLRVCPSCGHYKGKQIVATGNHPPGYVAWFDTLRAAAMLGTLALERAWLDAPKAFRQNLATRLKMRSRQELRSLVGKGLTLAPFRFLLQRAGSFTN